MASLFNNPLSPIKKFGPTAMLLGKSKSLTLSDYRAEQAERLMAAAKKEPASTASGDAPAPRPRSPFMVRQGVSSAVRGLLR